MNRLQFATLLSWAKDQKLEGRKRLQKVVFFLQKAGCPLDCQYILHHYGPYSRDVADTCDEMVAADLLLEDKVGASYSYKLSPKTIELLGKTDFDQLNAFESLGKELIEQEIWPLELGSTILYFLGEETNWDDAMEKACKFKNVEMTDPQSQKALDLAQKVLKETAA